MNLNWNGPILNEEMKQQLEEQQAPGEVVEYQLNVKQRGAMG